MDDDIISVPFDEEDIEDEASINRTYKMDIENGRIAGMIDGLEATEQALLKILITKRFAYLIYDDQYGCDIFNKLGNASLTQQYLSSDIPAMIEDAFSVVDTFTGLQDVEYKIIDNDTIELTVYAETIYGVVTIGGVFKNE